MRRGTDLPMTRDMAAPRSYGIWLGGASLAAGAAAFATDVSALGVVAGVAGFWAAVAARNGVQRLVREHERARARIAELEAELVETTARAQAEVAAAEERAAAKQVDLAAAAESSALIDPVTGLYGQRFFEVTLENRVAAARRHLRPVAVVLLQVAGGPKDGPPQPVDPASLSGHVTGTLREADLACHLGGARFGLVLEDTPENGAVWTVERVRRALAAAHGDLTLWAGVACYPAHAFEAGELLERARRALDAAQEWRQDRIEVATPTEV